MALQPNLNEFTVLQNLDRFPQLPLMNFINLTSTVLHAFLLYLIAQETSRRESIVYRVVSLAKTATLWASQLHWGSLHSAVFLFPFPGIYGIGYLTNIFSSFVLVTIWVILFGTMVLMLYLILVIRLKALARLEGIFSFSVPSYIIFTVSLIIFTYTPMLYCWLSAYSTEDQKAQFVQKYYPRCTKILEVPGVFVYDDDWKFQRIVYCARILLAVGGGLYVILCQIILFEIHQQCKTWSSHILKYHRKALKDTLVQNVILFIFLALAPLIQLLNAYKKPEEDTINITIAANLIFVSAPIPCTLTVIFQNTFHREYIFGKLGIRDRERTRVDSTHNIMN